MVRHLVRVVLAALVLAGCSRAVEQHVGPPGQASPATINPETGGRTGGNR